MKLTSNNNIDQIDFVFSAMFRVHFTINEAYTKEFANMESEAFMSLARNLTMSLNGVLVPNGTYTPRVVAIE